MAPEGAAKGAIKPTTTRTDGTMVYRPKNDAVSSQLESFTEWLLSRGRSEGTVKMYVSVVRRALESNDMLDLMKKRSLSPLTRRTARAAILCWTQYQEDTSKDSLIREEAQSTRKRARDFKLPPGRRNSIRNPFTAEEWRALVRVLPKPSEAISPAMRACIGIMLMRGLRVGDVTRIRRDDLVTSLRTGTLTVLSKGSKNQYYKIKPFEVWVHVLLRYQDWETVGNLVAPRAAQPQDTARVKLTSAFKVLCEAAGMNPKDCHLHRLRRTYATFYYDETKDLVKLQAHMGWANLQTAAAYVDHSKREVLEEHADKMLAELEQKYSSDTDQEDP